MLGRIGSERNGGEGGKLGLKAARDPRRFRRFPARPDVVEEMRDRCADQRVGEAHEDRRRQPRLDEVQRHQGRN